jgi:glutamate-1-semialdehyde 2,1-aminomutase
MTQDFAVSRRTQDRLHELVPGGAHTYAKGSDQYPEDACPVIARGLGAHVWDVDGNRFVEYGSGLRSVGLGHCHPEVLASVHAALELGTNFTRPSAMELSAAEEFLAAVPGADMVKFCKNASDATTAAVRLARAFTGRELVAVCSDQPFFSTDDWFIGTTQMNAGIPKSTLDLTVGFPYGDLQAVDAMFDRHPDEIACVVLEAAGHMEPPPGYLAGLKTLVNAHGALLVYDETITGFRWSEGGAQKVYGVVPDLSIFGKAIGNGFAVSALAGRREVMELGGFPEERERVFLLSTTHGAETHSLAAAAKVIEIYRRDAVTDRLHSIGESLASEVRRISADAGLADHVVVRGRACNLVFATLDEEGKPSQEFRTLFMRELIRNGVLAPSFVVSAALTDEDIAVTLDAVAAACATYRKALEHGDPSPWMGPRPVKPVFRRFA